jgi:hypothetical protein
VSYEKFPDFQPTMATYPIYSVGQRIAALYYYKCIVVQIKGVGIEILFHLSINSWPNIGGLVVGSEGGLGFSCPYSAIRGSYSRLLSMMIR